MPGGPSLSTLDKVYWGRGGGPPLYYSIIDLLNLKIQESCRIMSEVLFYKKKPG